MVDEWRRAGLRRVVEVAGDGSRPEGYGSAYAIGDDLVLTAGHVVGDRDTCVVRILGGREGHAADVIWTDRRPLGDAALLRVPSRPWREEPDRGGLRYGRVAGEQVACVARGFPRVQTQAGGVRDIESVRGTTDASAAVLLPRYEVNVTTALPAAAVAGQSHWQGLSGAALLGAGRQLLGVITVDSPAYAGGRLEAVPVQWLLADPTFAEIVGESVVSLEPVHHQRVVSEVDDPDGRILTAAHQPLPPVHVDYQLLQAKYGMVPFVGRAGEIDALTEWWRGPQLFGMAVVTGDAGAGKTRLAAQLCRIAAREGCSAGFVELDQWDAALADGGAVEIVWPTLLVVDYPDRLTSRVFQFLQAAMNRRRGTRLRVLMLDRTPGPAGDSAELPESVVWWRDLNRHTGGAARSHTQVVLRLQTGGLGSADREAHAQAAVQAFGDDQSSAVMLDLDEEGYANPLRIHLATLLSLRGRTVEHPRRVVEQFLDRERDRWTSRAVSHFVQDVSDVSRAQAVALITLTMPTIAECPDLLTAVPGLADPTDVWSDRRLRLTAWLQDLFPGDGERLAPLAPDLLAQQLLADTLDLPKLAMAIVDHHQHTAAHVNRMVDILQLAGREDARTRAALQQLLAERLQPLLAGLAEDPQLAALLATAVGLCVEYGLDREIGAAVARMPVRLAANGSAAQLWKALTMAAVGSVDDADPDRASLSAGLLTDLVAYHSILNERPQALARAREAYALMRRLGDQSDPYDVALVTLNLGTCLGRSATALAEAAVHLQDATTRFAKLDAPAERIDALLNLAACQADLGDRASAAQTYVQVSQLLARHGSLGLFTELGDMFQQLNKRLDRQTDEFAEPADPDAYRLPLGCAPEWFDLSGPRQPVYLQRLAGRLAAGAAQRMPTTRRDALVPLLVPKVARQQAQYAAENYSALLSLTAHSLAAAGQVARACVPAAESVEMLRGFVESDPELRARLGRRLRVLAGYQRQAGVPAEAIVSAEAAIAQLRMFLEEQPGARAAVPYPYDGGSADPAALPEISLACRLLAGCLEEAGRLPEAAQARRELVEVLVELAGLDARYTADLAAETMDLSLVLVRNNAPEQAVAAAREAVEIYRRLVADDPGFEPDLINALDLASGLALSNVDFGDAALTTAEELVERTRSAAEMDPTGWPAHGAALTSYSTALFSGGRFAEAEVQAQRAAAILAQLAMDHIGRMALAEALLAQATCVVLLGSPQDAPRLTDQALALITPWNGDGDDPVLLRCALLGTLAEAQLAMFDVGDALATAADAVSLFDQLPFPVQQQVGMIWTDLAYTRSRCHLLLQQPEEALTWAQSAATAITPVAATFLGAWMLARIRFVAASALLQLGRAQEARPQLEEALPVLGHVAERDPAGVLMYAMALTLLGSSHLANEDPVAAQSSLHEAVTIFEQIPGTPMTDVERARAESLYAGTLMQLSHVAEAVEHGREAVALLHGGGAVLSDTQPILATAYQAVAGGLAALGQIPDAAAAYAEAIGSLRQLDHRDVQVVTLYGQCLLGLAEQRLALNDPAGALANAVECQQVTAPDATPELWPLGLGLLHGAALVLQSQSLFLLDEPAADHAAAALRTLAPLPVPQPAKAALMATAYGIQATELARRGQTFEAIEPALAAVSTYRPLIEDPGMRVRCASAGGLAGACLLEHDRIEEAYPLLAEAVDLFASLPEMGLHIVHEHATTLANLGRCLLVSGATQEGLDAFTAALDRLETVPAEHDGVLAIRAVTAFEMAQFLDGEGLFADATSALRRAVTAHARLGQPNPDLAAAMDALGRQLRAKLSQP